MWKSKLAFNVSVTSTTESLPEAVDRSICDMLSANIQAGAMTIRTMMTSQDGIPVPGSRTFLPLCEAVIVSWKPSRC